MSDAEHAMEHMIVAMLWNSPGYSVQQTVAFLRASPELVSRSGHALGLVLDDVDADQSLVDVAADFWRTVLVTETSAALEGFGFLSQVAAMDAEVWEELMLQTVQAAGGRVDWSHGIAERLETSRPTTAGLAILNELVRGGIDDWDSVLVIEKASAMLARATDLQETDEYRRLRTTLLERGVIDD